LGGKISLNMNFKKIQKEIFKLFLLEKRKIFNGDLDKKHKTTAILINVVTEMGSSMGSILLIIIMSLISGIEIWFILFPIYLFQLICVEIFKKVFNRKRPITHEQKKNIFGVISKSGSFPSGHSANIFAMAFLVTIYYRTDIISTLVIFSFAGYIAFTRVLLGKHYLIDVLAGALAGLGLSVIGTYAWSRILAIIVANVY